MVVESQSHKLSDAQAADPRHVNGAVSLSSDAAPKKKARTKSKDKKVVASPARNGKKTGEGVKSKKEPPKPQTRKVDNTSGKKVVLKVKSSDWARLSESTLKRKTVKELVGYLADKVRDLIVLFRENKRQLCLTQGLFETTIYQGVECKDENGKMLRKDSLVGLVLSK